MTLLGIAILLGAQSPPAGLHGHVAVQVGQDIVLAGGITFNGPHRSVWVYSNGTKSWRQGGHWAGSRSFAVAVEHNGRAIILGGIGLDGRHSDRIDAYDSKSGDWSTIGQLPCPITRSSGVVWRGKLYLLGGFNGSDDRNGENSNKLWLYDFEKKNWRSRKPMPTPRHGFCLVPFQDRLWAIGGYGSGPLSGVVESYDPGRDQWRSEKSLPADRGFFGAGVVEGKLVAFGQIDRPNHPVEWSATGWRDRKAMDLPLRRFASIQNGNGFHVFGGEGNGPAVQRYMPYREKK